MSAIDEAFIRAYQTGAALPANAPQTPKTFGASVAYEPLNQYTGPNEAGPGQASTVQLSPRLPPAANQTTRPAAMAKPSARRPLSDFARPVQAPQQQFKPALEVDRFRWSPVCDSLVRNYADRLDGLVGALLTADDAGRSLIGIAGVSRGAGCTTLTACAARLLVAAGKSVAIVDGNGAAPGLASALGLAVQIGWEDMLAGGAPLAEAVVQSLDDKLAVLPLARGGPSLGEKLESIHASVTAGVLRYHYDIVLIDLGALDDPVQSTAAVKIAKQCRLDAVILASRRDSQRLEPQRLAQMSPELARLCLGQVQIAA